MNLTNHKVPTDTFVTTCGAAAMLVALRGCTQLCFELNVNTLKMKMFSMFTILVWHALPMSTKHKEQLGLMGKVLQVFCHKLEK